MMVTSLQQRGSIQFWLMSLLVVGFWSWFFLFAPKQVYLTKLQHVLAALSHHDETESLKPTPAELEPIATEKACADHFPTHGQAVLLSTEDISVKLQSRFHVVNEHIYPVMLTLINATTSEPLGAVFMAAGKDRLMNIPVGDYYLKLQSGDDWCNFSQGFHHAESIHTDQLIQIKANQVSNMRLMPYGNAPADVMLSFSSSLGVIGRSQGVHGTGSLILKRGRAGHYAVTGSINRQPAHFLIDTGATYVSMPAYFARKAGITACEKQKMMTANGMAHSCRATANELRIGQFTLRNVQVVYSKGMGNQLLLGMNVIRLFKMEQQGDVMKLSR